MTELSPDHAVSLAAPGALSLQERSSVAVLKRQAKAAECLARAAEAASFADASELPRVREIREAAAARWIELAALYEPADAVDHR